MRGLLFRVALLLFLPVLAHAEPILYGVSSSFPGQVYTINQSTGAATPRVTVTGSPGINLTGAEFLRGTLWATDVLDNTNRFTTGTINLTTGAYTKVSDQAGSPNWHGLAANQAANTLYSVDLDGAGSPLVSMTSTGAISTIGTPNVSARGLAFSDETGVLYAVDGNNLYTFNTANGNPTLIGALGLANDGRLGLAYSDQLDTLFLSSLGGLYTVNTATGAATLIGSNGTVAGAGIDGLAINELDAAPVPEPTSMLLLGIGAAGLAARARRKKT